jgi:tetratricopeptide (TPR) repeat protein
MSESSRSSKKTKKSTKWLIRTTDCKILGPYDNEHVKELIGSKKVVFLDEISRPGEDWTLIKNIDDFRELALGADYSLSESTANFDIEKLETARAKKRKVAPPKFKKPSIIISDLEDGEYVYKAPLMVKKHNVLIPAVVAIGVLAVIGLGYWAFESSVAKRSKEAFDETGDYFNKYYIKGKEYEEGGLFKEALKYYHKALAAKPYHSSVRIRKAAIDLVVLSNMEHSEKELQELYADANIGKIPDQEEQSDIKTFLGILEYKKGNLSSAEGYFNQALAIRPTNAFLYYNMGCVMMKRSDYKAAMEYFKNAQKLSANFGDAALLEAYSIMKQGKYKDAVKVFNSAMQQSPNMRELYTLGAYSNYMSSAPQAAFELLKKVVYLDPYYNKRVFTPLHQIPREDLINEEIDILNDMYKIYTGLERAQAGYILSILYMVKGNTGLALKTLDDEIYKDDDPIKLTIKGIIDYNRSEQKAAKEEISKSLALDYSNQLTHLYAGILAIEEDNLGQARNHLMKAQATDEYTSLYAITLMGDVMFRSGEKNTAMVMWKKVISMNQRYIPAWERILNFNQ